MMNTDNRSYLTVIGYVDLESQRAWVYLFCLFLLYAIILFCLPSYKFYHFGTLPDFNIFLDSFFSTLDGELFTNQPQYWSQRGQVGLQPIPLQKASMFGMHFRPFLFLLVPFFKLAPSAYTLFAIQAIIVASSVYPLFLLSRLVLCSIRLSLLCLVVYICYPLSLAVSTSFFPSFLAITFFSWALYFIYTKRIVAFLLAAVLILSIKEILAVPLFACGIYCWFKQLKMVGTTVCVLSLLYLFACTEYIIPAFSTNSSYSFSNYYGGSGDSIYTSILSLLQKPSLLLEAVLREKVLVYLANIFLPLVLLPLVSPVTFLALPVLLQNIFAQNVMHSLYVTGHLTSPALPYVFFGFICSISFLQKRISLPFLEKVIWGIALLALIFSVSILKGDHFRNETLKMAAQSIFSKIDDGDVVTFHDVPDMHAHFSPKNKIAHFLHFKEARWNIVKYDHSICNTAKQLTDISEQMALVSGYEVSLEVCRIVQDSCYVVHFDQPYYPDESGAGKNGHQFRVLVFENKCIYNDYTTINNFR